jgi:sugar transferase (PEP-CTERM system associated)
MIRLLNVYYPTRTVFLLISESLIIAGCLYAAVWIVLGSNAYLTLNYEYGAAKIVALTIATMTMAYYFDLYEPDLLFDRREIYFRIVLALGCVCLLVAGVVYFYPEFSISREVFPLALVLLGGVLCLWRRFYSWVAARSVFRERVCVLGNGPRAHLIAETLERRRDLGMDVVSCNYEMNGQQMENAAQVVKGLFTLKQPVNHIVIALEDRRGEMPMTDLLTLKLRGITVEEDTQLLERLNGKIQLEGLRPSSFLYSEGFRVKASQQFTRRVASMLAAAIGLTLAAPFLPLIMLLVRMSSPGPIFFKQIRVGEGGRQFTVYKFRTMNQNAEAAGAKWASKNDPRVTRTGLFMRKTRIDELPQLWNVLRGDMGFVGPRPERPEFVPWLVEQLPFYDLRHIIRPGLTGWAQVRYGYGATLDEAREKLAFDLYYVKHASLGFDLLIMFETIKIILHRKGAQ